MQTAKQEALSALAHLPDDATYEDMQYRLYVLEQIRAGIESAATEGSLSHEEARARMAKWLVG